MTYLKESGEKYKTLSSLEITRKHVENASKGCLILLIGLCLAMAILLVCRANPRIKTTSTTTLPQLESKMVDTIEPRNILNPCEISNCTVNCRNAKKIYEDVFQVLQAADCEENLVLVLNNQHFPNSILTNRWKPAQKAISSLVITNSDFTHIRNEAFNSIDFTKTEMLTLMGIKLKTLGNGVLLGFANLRSLHLEGRVQFVDRCFFQPVQASLLRLTLRVELIISGSENIFGISFMSHMGALDLSDNFIRGSLSRSFFAALPRIRYLTLSNSEISSIDGDAFDDIAKSLSLLDLSNNMLLTLGVAPFEKLLDVGKIKIYLLGNEWLCDCKLKGLINLYENYESNFGDIPYCRGPLSFYGVLLTNVTFDEDCNAKSDLEGLIATPIHYLKTESLIATSSSTETSIALKEVSFKMACLSEINLENTQEVPSSNDPVEYFLFAPPCHDFELVLLENNSVQVIVQYADEPLNIIWFSEALENFVHTVNGITIDYNCEMYSDPFLIAENLEENCTYTFCLVPSGTFSITPFNCLPLHVPSKSKIEPDIWISKEEKELTVGLVCLIFMCSLLLGGVIAYFGIKAYPDILEGSNHVLVVKKSNKAACYVSTITEGEYMIHKNSLKKKTSLDVLSPKLSSTISSSTEPEEIREESLEENQDYYEMPFIYNRIHDCQQKCMTNKCVITPSSPPPLPKRNSDCTIYGSPSEFISNVPFPSRSL